MKSTVNTPHTFVTLALRYLLLSVSYQYYFMKFNDAIDIYLAGLLLNLFSSKSFASSLKSYWPQPKLINSAIKFFHAFNINWDNYLSNRASNEGPHKGS